ncbi:MAG: prolyl oligopeptidase family serine peptidase [Opitutaceae bacterium]|nr:prolyl oligopeptidase family serine peptidase [Opitutaceae bacterium]
MIRLIWPGPGHCFLPATGMAVLAMAISSVAAPANARAAGMSVEEFTVRSGDSSLSVRLVSPAAHTLAAQPLLLLYFSTDRAASLPEGRYGAAGRIFLEQGHRVASFDLPAHGERLDGQGGGIAGLAQRVAAGQDPFSEFVHNGRAVIDECIRRGLAPAGRIVVAGVSRGGYFALRLAAADRRIAAAAAFAPVTDWRVVTEFDALKESPVLAALALENFAEQLAGRRIYLAIGNHDLRTGSDACTRLVLALMEAERRRGAAHSGVRFHLVDDSRGHALAAKWREEGVMFLLENQTVTRAPPMP